MGRLTRLILATVYLTWVLQYSSILDLPRSYVLRYRFARELLSCYKCTGLWVALLLLFVPKQVVMVLAIAGGNMWITEFVEVGGGIRGD